MGVFIVDLPQLRSIAEIRAFHTIRLLPGFPFVDSSKSSTAHTYVPYLIASLVSLSI